jgi:hypothetical protein
MAALPPPRHELAKAMQVFATALVYMAHQARRGHQALEWMRAQPCLDTDDICLKGLCPQCESKRIDYTYDEGDKKLVIKPVPPAAPDLSAPLIESKTNPGAA